MALKLFAKSKNGKMLKIGEDAAKSKWYFMSDPVIAFVSKAGFNNGDEVEIVSDNRNGSFYINKITKAGQMSKTDNPVGVASNDTPKKTYSGYGKTPEENESIKRQAIMKATAEAVTVLQGQITKEELPQYMVNLYDMLYQKVSE